VLADLSAAADVVVLGRHDLAVGTGCGHFK
jgi:hypothetical protein